MVEHAANVDAFNAALAKGYAATANHNVEVEKPTSPSSKKKKKGKGTKELKAVKELKAAAGGSCWRQEKNNQGIHSRKEEGIHGRGGSW